MHKDTNFIQKKTIKLQGQLLDLSYPIVMGILNITPDSFYDGGYYNDETRMLGRVEQLLSDGARILDIGGYSSRPGAKDITAEEERLRIIPAIKAIRKHFPKAILSVDTFRASLAEEALNEGAAMINDISAGNLDAGMFPLLGKWKVPYVLMHMRGTPQTMSTQAQYQELMTELCDFFTQKIALLQDYGLKDIILDPGFGFAKTHEQNYSLLKQLRDLEIFGLPLLVGLSRKSMIYKTLHIHPEGALNGTTVLNTIALMNNARMLRVHDVKEAVEAITLYKTVYN